MSISALHDAPKALMRSLGENTASREDMRRGYCPATMYELYAPSEGYRSSNYACYGDQGFILIALMMFHFIYSKFVLKYHKVLKR